MRTQSETGTIHIEHTRNYNQDITEFPINSYPPHKLGTVLRGPHKILGRHRRPDGPDVYTVQNLANSKLEDFKVTDLRPFRYDPQRINPNE